MNNPFHASIREMDAFRRVSEIVKKSGKILAEGVTGAQKAHLASALVTELGQPLAVITYSEQRAKEIYEDMRFFCGKNALLFPSKDILFYNADVKSGRIQRERLETLFAMGTRKDFVAVMCADALLDRMTPKAVFDSFILNLEVGSEVDTDTLAEHLVAMGYERTDGIEGTGQFSWRGGILDIFTPIHDVAHRIEFWGDEVDSIRSLDAENRRSVEKWEKLTIYPMRELVYDTERRDTAIAGINAALKSAVGEGSARSHSDTYDISGLMEVTETAIDRLKSEHSFSGVDRYFDFFYSERLNVLDYLPDNAIVYVDEPAQTGAYIEHVLGEFRESLRNRISGGLLLPQCIDMIMEPRADYYDGALVAASSLGAVGGLKVDERVSLNVRGIATVHRRIDLLEADLRTYRESGYRVVILSGGAVVGQRLAGELFDRGFSAQYVDSLDNAIIQRGQIILTKGSLSAGFEYPEQGFAVITGKEVFGEARQNTKRNQRKKNAAPVEHFSELKPGDYVVHERHGIGVYRGIEKITSDNISRDYLKISYSDGGVYVQTEQLDLISKYIGGENAHPKLNRLGGGEWQRIKSKAKQGVIDIARDLIALYAKRQAAVGFEFSKDTVWQNEFEETFRYTETDDQLTAIEDVKADMESPRVMDRLICGDVGYGKTEVAIRAAFKAACDSKQVAYLVPTTILAQQHYNTFVARMQDFPIRIAMLSRFATPSQQKASVEGIRNGEIDIVIGTHRILSKDLTYKNLGLVIIDEEQRFGVTHKEKLKQLKENVDVLTLTATPIPRTLHMSLTGIRDMSVLTEPPHERQPIQTYVMEYSPETVRDAVARELGRKGQVYYLHNRVASIPEVAYKLQELLPEAVVRYAHGQMSERELEKIMLGFINGEIDVLVSTTIIETGLDIPNVNTIIIQDADYYGLAQLYQLRGRVGRSNRTSYAYLMYKRDKVLTEDSIKRLQTIREFTEFGAGFKIAMRDLEIRGAGSLLGARQHGHMDAVGYDTYCRLLEEAVAELQGLEKPKDFETTLDFTVNAYIPEYFIESEKQKLEVYKKIALIADKAGYYDVQEELEDRFGEIPAPVANLLLVAYIKALAHSIGITQIKQKGKNLVLTFLPDSQADIVKLTNAISKRTGRLLFTNGAVPYLTYKLDNDDVNLSDMISLLEDLV